VPDVRADPDRTLWQMALGPMARTVIAIPFADSSTPVDGALVAGGTWTTTRAGELATLLEVVAMQIQLAIRTARLAEAHQDQMVALARMVVGLREQSQEHVAELLELEQALGDGSSAQHTESLVARHHTPGAAGRGLVENPIVAGLLLGEMSVARTRGIALRLSARSSLDTIPDSVGDLGFVSVISNLISNAFDAVETVPPKRRRVSLHLQQRAASTAIDVRDWGVGLGEHSERDVVRGGYSSKGAGRGTGLALVNRLVAAAGGTMKIERCSVGTRVKVTVPNG
jgi:sensor histidine kinase regulating citrate/malate metabolism